MVCLACAFLLLVIYIRSISKPATLASEFGKITPEPIEHSCDIDKSKFIPNSNGHTNSSNSKVENFTDTGFPADQKESKPAEFKKYNDAKQQSGNDFLFAVQWLNDSQAKQIPVKEILSKAKSKSKESFKSTPIKTRQEASDHLNVNVSFADPPSKAFESSDHFFFSAPLTQDFRRGFVINKETGEIRTW
jgi:hypothetical protein